jgi:hypothetical protein
MFFPLFPAIVLCPTCGHLARTGPSQMCEPSEIDVWRWTDGKQGEQLKNSDIRSCDSEIDRNGCGYRVLLCRACRTCFWIVRTGGNLGTTLDWDSPLRVVGEHTGADQIEEGQEPTEAEYLAALEKGMAKAPEQEKMLRLLAWWRGNDAVRWEEKQAELQAAPEDRTNSMVRLCGLLHASDLKEGILKAELLRQLGRFDEAAILAEALEGEMPIVAQELRALCRVGDRSVRRLDPKAESYTRTAFPKWRRHQTVLDHLGGFWIRQILRVGFADVRWCGRCVHRDGDRCHLGYPVIELFNGPPIDFDWEALSRQIVRRFGDPAFIAGQRMLASSEFRQYWLGILEQEDLEWRLPCSHSAELASCEPGQCRVLSDPRFVMPAYGASLGPGEVGAS